MNQCRYSAPSPAVSAAVERPAALCKLPSGAGNAESVALVPLQNLPSFLAQKGKGREEREITGPPFQRHYRHGQGR